MSAQSLREQAAQQRREAAASFERCDTDGFLSQWCAQRLGDELELQAAIEEAGGTAVFLAVFDLEGVLVPAKAVDTRYGPAWGLLPDDDPRGRFTGWFRESQARDPATAKATDAKKGFFVGYVRAPARARLRGSTLVTLQAVAVRTDGGFSREVEVVCNGHGPDLQEGLGGVYGRTAAFNRAQWERNAG
ncbi:hypothetical protein [Streptomonospora litoralis]|uniref:Uncharacterized protein n=1 Tax=Streptomonospora litoralis TaxID=2498135 RepID=A0A4P6Q7P2_9ACTN|nr:hypothetical protein [Streptomonospora litoralis]QBI56818.1 hypothetical protein EKD16_25390 [Streptomonospora litoralis]